MRLPPADLLTRYDDQPDAALLGRFLAHRDELAFAGLVQRHGPMVLGVCRRVLGDAHAAEDAFQATFLVLVRRAADANRAHLGPWLYGVAYRTALKARVADFRRTARERTAAATHPGSYTPAEADGELGPVLDEELSRLSDPLRTAVVLCDLEGLSRRQAARRLGCPESTLSSRLTLARERLAKELTRRGVAPVLAGLVAAVPWSLARATCSAAVAGACGARSTLPVPVARLSDEVIRTMIRSRTFAATGLVAAAALFITGAVILADGPEPKPQPEPAAPPAVADAGLLPVVKVVAPAREKEQGPLDKSRFLALDGFDGRFALNWKPVRPDESHVSLTKHPGQLTIVTQKGTIHTHLGKGNPNLAVKNIYLIDNPLAAGGNFTATTCLVEFKPSAPYHQAGIILYDDDDNYLKWVYMHDWKAGRGESFALVNEQGGERQPQHDHFPADAGVSKVWLRFTKTGDRYEYATSVDGERFVAQGTAEWGKGGPKRMGVIAKNGGDKEVAQLDARFEFFELKTP